MGKRDRICIATELEFLHGSESKPRRKGWGPTIVVLRVKQGKLAQLCDSKCFEEAGHNSGACFCACKMRKADKLVSVKCFECPR